jgi:hypothetical protein
VQEIAEPWSKRSEAIARQVLALLDALDAAEARIAAVEALAEAWRYKGEFGWGPWQTGEGPDPEGQILDDAAATLRAALSSASTDPAEIVAALAGKRKP